MASRKQHGVQIMTGKTAFILQGVWTGDEPLRSLCEAMMLDEELFPRYEYVPDVDWHAVNTIAKALRAKFFPKTNIPDSVLENSQQ